MKRFIKKIYICLFEPRKMGLYFGEKLYKSFLHVLLLTLIAILPVSISLAIRDGISNSSYESIETYLMEDSVGLDLKLSNGVLTGTKNFTIITDEAVLYVNPTGQDLKLQDLKLDIEYLTLHVIEMTKEGVEVSLLNNVSYKKTYEELGQTKIDFSKIAEADYIELDKFISIINTSFNSVKVSWVIINSLILLFDMYITILFSALILAFIVRIANPIIGFRFRFKGALDAQFISVLCLFLMILFKASFFRYIGIILSTIYLFRAMLAIVRIEVKRRMFDDKGEGE